MSKGQLYKKIEKKTYRLLSGCKVQVSSLKFQVLLFHTVYRKNNLT